MDAVKLFVTSAFQKYKHSLSLISNICILKFIKNVLCCPVILIENKVICNFEYHQFLIYIYITFSNIVSDNRQNRKL